MEIKKLTSLHGELTVPGDKSISHRAVMFGSLAKGTTRITHFLEGADCLSTISCFRNNGNCNRKQPGRNRWYMERGFTGFHAPTGHSGCGKQRHYYPTDLRHP